MSLVYDEYGRPFIIISEQDSKKRVKGLQAQKVPNIHYILFDSDDDDDNDMTIMKNSFHTITH